MNLKIKSLMLASALVVTGALAGGEAVLAYQGHMHAALNELNRAQFQLQAAIPDKAGHRVAAMRLIGQAIGETQAGIAAGAM